MGPKIILDVALHERLRGGRLVLHDTNGEALDDMYAWGKKGLEGAALQLEKTLRLEEALRGADFVVLSISTGGLDGTALDLEIPARYGVVQTVGDTVGPGGLRYIPVVVEIARAMERSCPEAVLLNLTNPLTILTRAVTKATSIQAVGLCHELFSTLGMLYGAGASDIMIGELPPPVAALMHPHVFNQEAIVHAGLIGDRELAFRAFKNDPLVVNQPEGRRIFEELFQGPQ